MLRSDETTFNETMRFDCRVPASRVKGEDMILVMGGVHWLSKIHMDTALKLLSEYVDAIITIIINCLFI